MSKPPDDEQRRLADAAEKQLQLPPGLLQRYLDNGGQIDAKQRAMVLDAYGIDPKLSKRNAVDAAGLALQDALQRNNGDPAIAIAELHGGQDRSKWNKGVNEFAARVSMPPPVARPTGRRSASGVQLQQQAGKRSGSGLGVPPPAQSAPVEGMTPVDPAEADAQQSMMPDEEIAAADARGAPPAAAPVQAAPTGVPPALSSTTQSAPIPQAKPGAKAAGPKTLDAYRNGTLDPTKRKLFEDLVSKGALAVPADFQMGVPAQAAPMASSSAPSVAQPTPAEDPGIIDRITGLAKDAKEFVTGDERMTPEIAAMPDWSKIPEWENLGTLKNVAGLGASPREHLQILVANTPGMTMREDEKGNPIVYSPSANAEFAMKPGFDKGDAVRALAIAPVYAANVATGGLLSFTGKGLLGAAGREALLQTGFEAAQAGSGGEFNPGDIVAAAAAPVLAAGAGAVKNAAGTALRKGANAALDALPGSTTRAVADAAAQVSDTTATQAIPGIGGATRQAAADVAQASSPPIKDPADIAELLVAANKKGPAAEAAKQELANLAAVDPKIAEAAARQGIEMPVDMMSGNEQFKNLAGLARSKIGSEAQAEFAGAVDGIVKRADDIVKEFATVVEGSPSSAAVSGRVLDRMKGMQAELKQAASAAHETIAEAIPKATKVNVSGALAEMQKIVNEVGSNSLSTAERKLQSVLSDPSGVTYQALKRQKDLIGKALEGQDSPFSNMATGDLKRLYGLIAQAQEEAVRGVGGDALVKQLKAANALTVAQKGIEERMVAGFGRDANGDLADKMTRAITAAKGEKTKPLDDLLAIVPEDMHREVIATAVAKVTSGKDGVFSPEKFVDFYLGARSNPAAMAKIDKIMGPKVMDAWRDLFEVSKAVATAKPKVKFTGIGNQELEAAVMGNGLIGKVLSSSVARKGVAAGAGAAAGAMTGSPLVAGGVGVIANAGIDALMNARASVRPAMGKLFISPEFKALSIAAATKGADAPAVKEAARKLVTLRPFINWWKATMNVPYDPKAGERWILAAMQAAKNEREQ